MSENLVLYEVSDRIAIITINRPEKLNALNKGVLDALEEKMAQAFSDPRIGVVILTGAGEKAFIAGADISQFPQYNPQDAKAMAERGQKLMDFIERGPKPVIAAINGYALGGGLELAMACTLRIAAENAMLGQPEVKLGIIPGYGGTQRLPRLVGEGRAMELILTGKMISADEAYRMGLVNQVVSFDKLMEASKKMAGTILKQAPLAVRAAKESIHEGLSVGLSEGCFLEAQLFSTLFATEDQKEGAKAFLEKRSPNFKGA